jgi:ubiquinone/menaquinone biosynthesis C-methylase UbiE
VNHIKAAFFDTQVNEVWAASEYDEVELWKIERMMNLAGVFHGAQIIEPGCGIGRLTRILSSKIGRHGHVLACDISQAMIDRCRLQPFEYDNVSFICCGIEEYTFAQGSYDIVICHNVFPHFDDKESCVRHLARALKQAGKFVVFHFHNSAWINDLHRKTHPCVFNDLIPGPDEMKRLFGANGLGIDHFTDDENGYLLVASFVRGN